MATNETSQTLATPVDADVLIERLRVLPEPESLEFYSQLSPKLQWLARQRMTGQRQKALIAYHAKTFGGCR
jgi:hypothetical protein